MGALSSAARRIRPLLPAPTIRLRLTLLYGAVFLVTGAVLLTIGYALVRHNLGRPGNFRQELRRLGIAAPPRLPPRVPDERSRFARFGADVLAQLRRQALHRLVIEYAVALFVMTLLSVAAGWLLAGRALRPLRRITATARRVSGENLGERIALAGPADELRELADTFDGMLARLDGAFASQRRFVANASHELRTPLAIMRTEIDVALADPDAGAGELRGMGEGLRESIDRCERLIDGLLVLARSESLTGREEPVDLSALAADCVTDLEARARASSLAMHAELGPAWTRGEPALLERMVANLIDNAIRHNEPGGFVRVRTARQGDGVEVLVANGGRLIEAAEATTLTEPFRRLQRSGEGFGLGLSIVRTVAEAHRGWVAVKARPGGGLEVRVGLPALSEPYVGSQPQSAVALTRT